MPLDQRPEGISDLHGMSIRAGRPPRQNQGAQIGLAGRKCQSRARDQTFSRDREKVAAKQPDEGSDLREASFRRSLFCGKCTGTAPVTTTNPHPSPSATPSPKLGRRFSRRRPTSALAPFPRRGPAGSGRGPRRG
jgi:hypothetical protein